MIIPFGFYKISGSVFNPNELSGLTVWLDPSDSNYYTLSGTDYISLTNKADGLAVFSPTTVAKRPAQLTKANGLNYMVFDGAVDTCMFSDITINLSHTDKLTMFWAGQHTAAGNGLMYEHSANQNTRTDAFIFNFNASTRFAPALKGNIGYVTPSISAGATAPLSTDELYSIKMDKALSTNEVYDSSKNGVLQTMIPSLNSNNTNLFGNHIGYIGARGNTTAVDLDGKYYEFLIYDRILTSDEVDQVTVYLNDKWDLY